MLKSNDGEFETVEVECVPRFQDEKEINNSNRFAIFN